MSFSAEFVSFTGSSLVSTQQAFLLVLLSLVDLLKGILLPVKHVLATGVDRADVAWAVAHLHIRQFEFIQKVTAQAFLIYNLIQAA